MTLLNRPPVATTIALVAAVASVGALPAQSFPPPLTDQQVQEVRRTLEAMKLDARGPYLRLRWFCADGSVQLPAGTPCAERGGGVQHAEPSDAAKRLAALQLHIGTILQAEVFDSLFDAAQAHYRLRELVLENYLIDIDDGWVLRRARFYRGARQIEDEERTGHAFLEWLLGRPGWTSRHFLLASQLAAVVPHARPGGEQITHRIRNLATEVSGQDPGFLDLRVKIHSFPSVTDLAAVDAYLGARSHPPEVRASLAELRDLLQDRYGPERTRAELAAFRRRLGPAFGAELAAIERSYREEQPRQTIGRLAALARSVRQRVEVHTDGRAAVPLMDLLNSLGEQAFVLAQEWAGEGSPRRPRRDRLEDLTPYFGLAYAAGFLSAREHDALVKEVERVVAAESLAALEYRTALQYLSRSLDWSAGTVRSLFSPAYDRYALVEPKAAGFLDAMLRGSIILPLSQELDRVSVDADRLLGASHVVLGEAVSQGVRGLNPGIALRPLEIVEPGEHHPTFDATRIYVLPETTAELRPVAGVLTLDAGNLLSHVQLLARNLAIPNASITSGLLPEIRAARGEPVLYAVSPLGRVVLKRQRDMTGFERQLLDQEHETRTERVRLDVSRLRLERTAPVPLHELRAELSGVIVGPKAGNLGTLAAAFPDRVSAGVALPFGMFQRHANRTHEGVNVLEDLRAAYRRAAAMRGEGRSEPEIDQHMFAVLARVRHAILTLEWDPEIRQAIVEAVRETFGGDPGGGVFVRSDTNVEDLPQFSGAGLNLTVPHQRTVEDVLAAVKRVWTSPFSERAYLWRKQILEEQGDVYPSVLLQASVPSEKSGVLISSGLQFGGLDHLTIAAAEGVGGAVEGEDAETIVVRPDGQIRLLSQAKAPQRRALVSRRSGGVTVVPAERPEYLLTPEDIRQLQTVVAKWKADHPDANGGRIWDIEFGFVEGKLWLFQIRPFIRFRSSELLARLAALDQDIQENARRPVPLREPI